jgi:ribosome biogenesis protein MAK21
VRSLTNAGKVYAISLGKISSATDFSNRDSEVQSTSRTHSAFCIMGKKRKRSEKDHASSSSVIELPSFDESALSALTNKIESGFRKTVAPGQNYRGRNPSRAEDPKRGTNRVQISKPLTQDRVPEKEYDARSIGRDETGHGSGSARARKDERSAHNGDEQNVLLQEILALGGTEDDLDLVMGVATDEDDLGDAIPKLKSTIDPKLTKEVSKFIASLGIETQSIEKLSGAGSDEDTEDESQNISTKFKSQSANEVKGVKSSNLQGANNSSKGLKDLVSKSPLLYTDNFILITALDV